MFNTVTLPRASWNLVIMALNKLMADRQLGGGSLECIMHNIDTQLMEVENV
jgi:hypothetical protein